MAKSSENRYSSMDEMLCELNRFTEQQCQSPQALNNCGGSLVANAPKVMRRLLAAACSLILLVLLGSDTWSLHDIAPSLSPRSNVARSAQRFAFRGHVYVLTSKPETWMRAEQEAVALGGHLVAINDQAEQGFLNETFLKKQTNGTYPVYWIGLHANHETGLYCWSSGDPISYVNWNLGEPNRLKDRETVTAINWHYATGADGDGKIGDWNDLPNSGYVQTRPGPYFGIVELPAASKLELD